jgi:prepilin signal peptidase PulO-like enzyme (type II secretory pathway)
MNVPIFGFLGLRGKCYFCKSPISWRYIMVEFSTACLWMALYNRIATDVSVTWLDFILQALFGAVLIAMVFIDLDHFIAPDELNVVGFVLGLARDIGCFGIAFYLGMQMNQPNILKEYGSRYFYFGWLPQGLIGALVYAGILYLVAYLGWVYYAKGKKETLGEVSRRFLTLEDLPEEKMTDEEKERLVESELQYAEEEKLGPAPRLRFSPGFLAITCSLLLIPSFGFAAPLAFFGPLIGFLVISRQPGEAMSSVLRRFFSSNDLEGPPETPTVFDAPAVTVPDMPVITSAVDLEEQIKNGIPIPTEPEQVVPDENLAMTMHEEADAFARRAGDGGAGGMGLGDVKLAAAVGAMLGPGMALLSLFFATLLGAITGIIFTRLHGKSLRTGVPFVPFMAAGAIIVMLFGNGLVNFYLISTGLKKPEPKPERPHLLRQHRSKPTPDVLRPYRDRLPGEK